MKTDEYELSTLVPGVSNHYYSSYIIQNKINNQTVFQIFKLEKYR